MVFQKKTLMGNKKGAGRPKKTREQKKAERLQKKIDNPEIKKPRGRPKGIYGKGQKAEPDKWDNSPKKYNIVNGKAKTLINSKYSDDRVRVLEMAFENDLTVKEACAWAGISETTYNYWQNNIDGFAQRMAFAKTKPYSKAKQKLQELMESEDEQIVLKACIEFLKRRSPEYMEKTINANVSVDNKISDEDREQIDKLLELSGFEPNRPNLEVVDTQYGQDRTIKESNE